MRQSVSFSHSAQHCPKQGQRNRNGQVLCLTFLSPLGQPVLCVIFKLHSLNKTFVSHAEAWAQDTRGLSFWTWAGACHHSSVYIQDRNNVNMIVDKNEAESPGTARLLLKSQYAFYWGILIRKQFITNTYTVGPLAYFLKGTEYKYICT